MTNPEGRAVSDGNRMAMLGGRSPPSGRSDVHVRTGMTPNAIHISHSKTWPRVTLPGLKLVLYLKGGYAGSCLRQVTQDAVKKRKEDKKKNLLFFSVLLQNIESRM